MSAYTDRPWLSLYRDGEFVDLCRGPHIPHAGKVGAFKLLSIAGSYWKAHTDRKMLQRVYGTAFFDKKELDAHLAQVEEAKKRDHRRLGKELGLFTISQMVGSGLILWMPKGAIVRGLLENFLKEELIKLGLIEPRRLQPCLLSGLQRRCRRAEFLRFVPPTELSCSKYGCFCVEPALCVRVHTVSCITSTGPA